jgi:hypothetical protein
MFVLAVVFLSFFAVVFSYYFYYQAWCYGLATKRWALLGLFFGPFVLPFFYFKKHLTLKRLHGGNYALWKV